MSESAHPRIAAAKLIIADRFISDHRPIPAVLCLRQSGDTSASLDPQAEQTKRRAPAKAGNGVSGARQIAANGRQPQTKRIALRHRCAGDALGLQICDLGGAMVETKGAAPQN